MSVAPSGGVALDEISKDLEGKMVKNQLTPDYLVQWARFLLVQAQLISDATWLVDVVQLELDAAINLQTQGRGKDPALIHAALLAAEGSVTAMGGTGYERTRPHDTASVAEIADRLRQEDDDPTAGQAWSEELIAAQEQEDLAAENSAFVKTMACGAAFIVLAAVAWVVAVYFGWIP